MSYILDALKRADAERGERRNTALDAPVRPAADLGAAPVPPARRLRWPLWLGAGLAVLAAAVAWQPWKPSAPVDAPPPARASAPTPGAPAAPSRQAPPHGQTDTAPRDPSTAQAPVLPILAQSPPPRPTPRPVPPPSAQSLETAPPPPPPRSDTLAQTAQSVAAEPPALSAAERAALPPIQISGSAYSANQDHRMLIANGQVVKEGQELTPGLTLEVIGPRSAVFNHRGTRFNVNY
jgi:general secretion pathway protein B